MRLSQRHLCSEDLAVAGSAHERVREFPDSTNRQVAASNASVENLGGFFRFKKSRQRPAGGELAIKRTADDQVVLHQDRLRRPHNGSHEPLSSIRGSRGSADRHKWCSKTFPRMSPLLNSGFELTSLREIPGA